MQACFSSKRKKSRL